MPRNSRGSVSKTIYVVIVLVLSLGLPGVISAQNQDASQLPLQKGHTNAILEVKWSPNDKLLLTYSAADGFLNIWQMPQGKLISTIEDATIKIKSDDKRALRAFTWSYDSRLIATGSENGSVQVWEAETGKLAWTTRIADEYVTGVGFSHDTKYLAAVAAPENKKHKLVLLDGTKGQVVKELGEIDSRFLTYYHDTGLVFSDDNKQLLVGDTGGIVTRWDLDSGSLLTSKTLELCRSQGRMPNAFAYSEDLALIVARCGIQTDVIDTNTGSFLHQSTISVDFSNSVVISRDKHFVAIGNSGTTRLLNLQNGTEVTLDFELPISCGCSFSKDNSLLAFDDYFDSKTVKVINLNNTQVATRLEAHPGEIKALVFSPDGRLLVSASEDRLVRVWNVENGSLLRILAGHTKRVNVAAFTPDGKLLVSAGDDQTMKIWDIASGRLIRSVQVTTEGIYGLSSIAFSPDGKQMVTTLSATVGLWDVEDWTLVRAFTTNESHTSGDMTYCCGSTAKAARFDAAGRLIISGHGDGTIKIWDPKVSQPLPLPGSELIRVLNTSETNESFALSPNEKYLVTNDGTAAPKIWNWTNSKTLRNLSGNADYIHNVVFSPDSELIATSDISGTIQLWNVKNGRLLRELDGGYSSDDALAFSPDGARLSSGGENQNIIMWDVTTGKRLWSILPIRERYRPTPAEIAEQQRAAARSAAKKARAERDTQLLKSHVFISFSHFGEPNDPAQMRLAETGRPARSLTRQSKSDATGVWLRFQNHSRLPVKLSTESIYISSNDKCGYHSSQGRFFNGLCDGAEIGIRFAVIDAHGDPIRYGFDFGGMTMVPPNTSAFFSVPRELLREGRSIVINYSFLNEDEKGKLIEYGKSRELRFSESNLNQRIPSVKALNRRRSGK